MTADLNLWAYVNYSGSVDDRRTNLPAGVSSVDAFTTIDVHLNYALSDDTVSCQRGGRGATNCVW